MDLSLIHPGLKVTTRPNLSSEGTKGMLIAAKYLNARTFGTGIVRGIVPGHGGDVWWVEHVNGDIAVYCFTEIEEA